MTDVPAKVNSGRVHAGLKRRIGPVRGARDFAPISKTSCALARPTDDGNFLVVYAQIDKSGWQHWQGSKFTVNFEYGVRPEAATRRPAANGVKYMAPTERWACLATADDLARARELQAKVIASAQPLPAGVDEVGWLDGDLDAKYWRGDRDVWCRYRSENDIEEWGQLFADALPGMLDRFTPDYSPQSERPRGLRRLFSK